MKGKRKLIDIKDEDFMALSIKATKSGKLLKPYIEDLLCKDARNELHTKEHFLNTVRKCEGTLIDADWVCKNLFNNCDYKDFFYFSSLIYSFKKILY